MGHEGRGKSKADGLKAMESEATLHFGLFFSEADLGVIHIYVHTYACMHMHSHTYTHTLCIHLQPIKTRVVWICLAHSWDLCSTSSRQHPLGNHHRLLVTTANCHPQAPWGGTPQPNWIRGALGECHLGPGRKEKEKLQASWAGSWCRSGRPRGNGWKRGDIRQNSKGKIWGEGRGQTCSSGQYCQLTKELRGRLPSGLNLGLAP